MKQGATSSGASSSRRRGADELHRLADGPVQRGQRVAAAARILRRRMALTGFGNGGEQREERGASEARGTSTPSGLAKARLDRYDRLG